MLFSLGKAASAAGYEILRNLKGIGYSSLASLDDDEIPSFYPTNYLALIILNFLNLSILFPHYAILQGYFLFLTCFTPFLCTLLGDQLLDATAVECYQNSR